MSNTVGQEIWYEKKILHAFYSGKTMTKNGMRSLMHEMETMTKRHRKGQGLVEFALVMPIFLTLLMGIVEFGRLMIIYSGAATASREAARYGASVGTSPSGIEHFRDCDGIRATAKNIAGLTPIEDQQLAGLVMWIPMGALYTCAALFFVYRWMFHRPHSPALHRGDTISATPDAASTQM